MLGSYVDLGIIMGGPQGSGIDTSMWILTYTLARKGYRVIADREYYSNITGRHSYTHMRVSSIDTPRSLKYPVEVLVAPDAETIFTHYNDLSERGILIYDTSALDKRLLEISSMENETKKRIARDLRLKGLGDTVESILEYLNKAKSVVTITLDTSALFKELVEKFKINPRAVSKYVSTVLATAVASILGLDTVDVMYGLRRRLSDKPEILEQNEYVVRRVSSLLSAYQGILKLAEPEADQDKLLVVTGNEVVAMGKIIGGVRFQSYYPITPASDESFVLEKYEYVDLGDTKLGPVVVFQAEDEIAVMSSAIGAALTGARSSTSTSGPGFDLMIESIGWAGMNEVPVVITYYQRGGPSTGLPTRGSQSDLFNAISSGHGEFARVVISSGDHEEALRDAAEAFNIAERYQLPVIHLLDKFLANTIVTIPLPERLDVENDRGDIISGAADYKRFDMGILVSPRAFLGTPGVVMWYTGDEHDEYGHISEDPENRTRMYSKRIKKLELVERELPTELKLTLHGSEHPDYVLIGWGSTKGVAVETIEALENDGLRGLYVNVKLLWPTPVKELIEVLRKVPRDKVIAVEHSFGVNIAELIAMKTGFTIEKRIAKYNGRPIYLNELKEAVKSVIVKNMDRIEVSHGA